ncbi:MAG: division/cell wall cluster transcriptional repressor MraZ [candidate division WOR-3 bacterium]
MVYRFRGLYRYALDSKGRVAIPARYRRILPATENTELLLNIGLDKTVEVHPPEEWEKFENDILLRLSKFHVDSLRLRRYLESNVEFVKLDAQGRILIPSRFLKYAEISSGEVVIAGVGNYFEIWNPQIFDEYHKKAQELHTSDMGKIDEYLNYSKNFKFPGIEDLRNE